MGREIKGKRIERKGREETWENELEEKKFKREGQDSEQLLNG